MSLADWIFEDSSSSYKKKIKDDFEFNIGRLFSSTDLPELPDEKLPISFDLEVLLNSDTEFETESDKLDLIIDFDEDSTENQLNKARSHYIDQNYTKNFVSILREEEFEFGYSTRSEEILNQQLQINELATRNWLNEIFIKYYSDEKVIIGILRIIGRFEPALIFPQGQTIALAALTHQNDEIKELGIRALEKWCSLESLEILKNIHLETEWLKEYVSDVISDLEEQLCLY